MNLIPYSRNMRTVLNCEKIPLREFFDEPDTPLDIRVVPPPPGKKYKMFSFTEAAAVYNLPLQG